MTDIRHIGYIRSSLYTKTIGMFRPERLVEIYGQRRTMHKTRTIEAAAGCVVQETSMQEQYVLQYKREKKSEFPVKGMTRLLNERRLTDMILSKVVIEMTSGTKTVQALNDVLNYRYEQKHTPEDKRVFLAPGTKLYATFVNNPSQEAQSLRYVQALNAAARIAMNSAIGVLDLSDIKTERHVQYGEPERWPIDEDIDLIRSVLLALDFGGWPESERLIDEHGIKVVPKPAALRQYTRARKDAWSLTQEVEL